MKEKKYYIAFDRYEQGTMINASMKCETA